MLHQSGNMSHPRGKFALIPRFSKNSRKPGRTRDVSHTSGRVRSPPRKRRNELKSGGEATQFDLGSSHGTPSCPFPDESVLHVRCLRYAESPTQSVVCGEDLGRKRAAAVPGDTCVAWAARALSFFFFSFFFSLSPPCGLMPITGWNQ